MKKNIPEKKLNEREERAKATKKRRNEKAKKKRLELLSKGLCRCGNPLKEDAALCDPCLIHAREISRNHYRKKAGIPIEAPVASQGRKRK